MKFHIVQNQNQFNDNNNGDNNDTNNNIENNNNNNDKNNIKKDIENDPIFLEFKDELRRILYRKLSDDFNKKYNEINRKIRSNEDDQKGDLYDE